ncbi:uncharacterized protein [Procambarus clarkii]|uniref:uncharacterized protein isoform X1 n=2 Tax=Procambarus clarkii TaxID=6728 RepID=UPI0037420496
MLSTMTLAAKLLIRRHTEDFEYKDRGSRYWGRYLKMANGLVIPKATKEYNTQFEGEKGGSKRRQHCTYCKNHGFHSRKTNHKCQYETCKCLLCELTRLSRLVMRHQQRLWRHLKDTKRREDAAEALSGGGGSVVPVTGGSGGGPGGGGGDPGVGSLMGSVMGGPPGLGVSSKQQKCDMCRNHGVMVEKRAHKNACPYQTCVCALCGLTKKRRDIMRHQQRVRRSQVTSQQRNEAYDYVMQTTAELAQLSNDGPPVVRVTPTTTTTKPTPMTALPPPPTPEAPPACSTYSPISCSPDTLTTSSPDARNHLREPPPLEVLENSLPLPRLAKPLVASDPRMPAPLGPGLHSDTSLLDAADYQASLDNATATWRNLKRERQEMDSRRPRLFSEASLFRNFDFVRSNNNLMVRDEAMRNVESICAYDSVSRMELVTHHDPPFVPSLVEGGLPRTAPTKKTRFTLTNEDLYYNHRFWGANPMDTGMSLASNDLQQVNYRRMPTSGSPEVRMRSLPALIPLHQQQHQPLRPQPLTPLRHPTFPPSMEWDPANLPYLAAYSLLQTSTYNPSLPTTPFGLGRVAPFLHPSVP